MPFLLTELIIESTIREGLENIRNDSSIVDDVFANLKTLPIFPKYGERELNKIKKILETQEINVVHAFPADNTKMPCISIQLLSAKENERRAVMDDYWKDEQVPMNEEELAEEVIVSTMTISSYDPITGFVEIDDSVDLSQVHINHLLVDADGAEFIILGGIDNTLGQKRVIIQKDAEVNTIGPAVIKSQINFKQYEVRVNNEQETVLLGVHTKDALQTKYMYTLLKYIIESRKKYLIERGFLLATYEGSDFTQNNEFSSDYIYSRYLTVSGAIENSWNSDKVIPIDLVEVEVKVEKDRAGNEDLGLQDSTIQVQEDD